VSTRCVVFSLYGSSPVYLRGMVENAQLLPEVYPGWGIRVYCERGLDCGELRELGCDVWFHPRSRKHSGMFWRFLAAWDTSLERVIFRDADSRLNVREAAAVQEWIESGKAAHCMHDHPHHTHLPVSGGMWGIRVGCLPLEVRAEVENRCRRPQRRVADMRFLRDRVYPLVNGSVLHHSSQKLKWESSPFPDHLPYDGFVGQQYNEQGQPIWPPL